ncbi:MAG: alanine racemase [Bacteroidales bacterium]|nr:alanine racemase [Bacteroidales bacterium]
MKIIDKEILAIDTPRVMADYDIMLANIQMVHNHARRYMIDIKPHVKSHKCLDIARIQLDEGAIGLTAAKCDEAAVFFNGMCKSFTIAYPLVEHHKIQRILSSTKQFGLDMSLIVDSEEGFEAIALMAERQNVKVKIYLKIDVGLKRCGLPADDQRILKLSKKILEHKQLELTGLISHAGHVYRAKNIQEVIKIAQEELKILFSVRKLLLDFDIETRRISIGATPTLLTGIDLQGISEIRPGNYIFLDRLSWKLGLIAPEQIALTVMATVVSKNKSYFIVDAGSKVLSSDTGAHASKILEGYGLAYPAEKYLEEDYRMKITALSEEHGFVSRSGFDLPIGSRVRIIPNHACPVVNLTDSMVVHQKGMIKNVWKVHARGKVL